jgi:hypothetical protein
MRIAVLADDDGQIIAIAQCRMSMNGQVESLVNEADIRAEIRRSDLDAYRGRSPSPGSAVADEVITSVTIELPEELHRTSLDEIHQKMILDRSGPTPVLRRGQS